MDHSGMDMSADRCNMNVCYFNNLPDGKKEKGS